MTDAHKILDMLLSVDIADEVALNEIDIQVWEYINRAAFPELWFGEYRIGPSRSCTRSRDALKAIRPAGWQWYLVSRDDSGAVRFGGARDAIGTGQVESPSLPTEELAELYAIVQALAYERSVGG